MNHRNNWSGRLLWAIYLALLLVLLPHTAWAFARFEPATVGWLGIRWGVLTAWAAAFAFEAAIAALTHKLADRIANTPICQSGHVFFRRLSYQYLNAYAIGLLVTVAVSGLANFGHAVEYGQDFALFGQYGISQLLFSVAFGGILPLVSLLFARILADTNNSEAQMNPKLVQAEATISDLQAQLHDSEFRMATAEAIADQAEQRFAAAGDLMARLFAEEKRQRILAISDQWPRLPASSIAIIAEASQSYVSEVLKNQLPD